MRRNALEHGGGLAEAGVCLEIDQAAHQLVERVVPHPRVAVRADSLGPFREEPQRLVADLRVASGAVDPRHAAQPLPENGAAVLAAPAAERLPWRLQTRGRPEPVQDVIVIDGKVEVATSLVLALPVRWPQPHAGVIEDV